MVLSRGLGGALLASSLLATRAQAATIRIECDDTRPHAVSALGLSAAERALLASGAPAERARALAVFTGASVPGSGIPPIAGAYRLDAEGLHFRPLFPFVSGLLYTARLDLGHGAPLVSVFEVAPPTGEPPRVTGVFPSGEEWPENTLRVYLYFSRPMEMRDAQRHVRLVDERGRPVPLAFVEVDHGLWDPGRRRLTLLFHPGRIKRGVAPGEAMGPPLRAGGRYRLVVDAALRDGAGRALGSDFEREVQVTAADRDPPWAGGLRVRPPSDGAAAVVLELPEPLDEALLRRLVWVEDAQGRAVAGRVEVAPGEQRWSLRPEREWTPGRRYALRVSPALEDRAGNRFDRAFDRETEPAAATRPGEAKALRIEFTAP